MKQGDRTLLKHDHIQKFKKNLFTTNTHNEIAENDKLPTRNAEKHGNVQQNRRTARKRHISTSIITKSHQITQQHRCNKMPYM